VRSRPTRGRCPCNRRGEAGEPGRRGAERDTPSRHASALRSCPAPQAISGGLTQNDVDEVITACKGACERRRRAGARRLRWRCGARRSAACVSCCCSRAQGRACARACMCVRRSPFSATQAEQQQLSLQDPPPPALAPIPHRHPSAAPPPTPPKRTRPPPAAPKTRPARAAVTQPEVEALYRRFRSLDRGLKGYISAEEFLGIPELSINPLAQRVVRL
jgi:hypothetical protein